MTDEFEGRVALVTGGSSGIGFAAARKFLRAGARVAICARKPDRLEAAFEDLSGERPGRVWRYVADMSDAESASGLVKNVMRDLHYVDCLINNAGEVSVGDVETVADDVLRRQLDTKLFGYWRLMRAVVPGMKERKAGSIVNVVGGAGKEPDPRAFGSSITNAALLALSKTASLQWAGDGIRVNAVCPGFIRTDLWTRNADQFRKDFSGVNNDEMMKNAARSNAMNRFGTPDEVADAIYFLSSASASYLSGVTINVDGNRLRSLW